MRLSLQAALLTYVAITSLFFFFKTMKRSLPASEMNWIYRYGKYACGARWCTSAIDVIKRLKNGKAAVPYSQLF